MYNPQQFLGDEKVLPKVVIWHLVDVLARGIWNTQMRTHNPNEEESNTDTKRKQSLRQNELKNQANHFKHGRGH